jgi:hypothetical protein
MPGNTVKINNIKDLEWYVGDSKLDRVVDLLDQVGDKIKCKLDEEKVIPITGKESTKMEMLDQWLKELIFPGDVINFIQEGSGEGDMVEVKRTFSFYTDNHQYFIKAIERYDGDKKSYLGCGVNSRKMRAGEDWTRGNDLPDGEFTKETWDKIINAIVCYELVKLTKYQKPDSIPQDTA